MNTAQEHPNIPNVGNPPENQLRHVLSLGNVGKLTTQQKRQSVKLSNICGRTSAATTFIKQNIILRGRLWVATASC
jgi:hypothetical protein